jgi:tetratricopeptide (TPR) repeat protein
MTTIESLIAEAYGNWGDAQKLFVTGRELHDRNRLPVAREVLRRALELDPQVDTDAWAYLAFACFRDFDAKGGEEVLREGIEATGSDGLKSTLTNFSSDPEEVERLREEIKDSDDPGVRAAHMSHEFYFGDDQKTALADLMAYAAGHTDDEDAQETLMWVLMSAKARNVDESLDLREVGVPIAQKRIDAEPNRIFGHWMKLQMLIGEEDWEATIEATGHALERFPDEETMMQFRGRACRETGDEVRAADWFSRAIGAKPSFVGARIDLAKLHEKNGRIDVAEAIFREIPVANPDYAPGPVSIALFLARQERFEEAETLFLEAWPNLPPWFAGQLGNNPDAKPLLERDAIKAVMAPADSESQNEGE